MQELSLPTPFPTPRFRACTEENFSNKVLTDSDRKYVVRTLATVLMTYVSKPSLKQCRVVAKRVIEEHEFLKDDEGDGDVSLPGVNHNHVHLLTTYGTLGSGLYITVVKMSISLSQVGRGRKTKRSWSLPRIEQSILMHQCLLKMLYRMKEILICLSKNRTNPDPG